MKTIPEIFADFDKKCKELDAHKTQAAQASVCCDVATSDVDTSAGIASLRYEVDYLRDSLKWVREDMDSLRSQLYEHTSEGHLPSIEGAAAMSKALKALGLENDYTVEKQVVYASDGSLSNERFIISKSAK